MSRNDYSLHSLPHVSVNQVKEFFACSQRYFYKRILELDAKEEEETPKHFIIGRVFHEAAQKIFDASQDHSLQECLEEKIPTIKDGLPDKEENEKYVDAIGNFISTFPFNEKDLRHFDTEKQFFFQDANFPIPCLGYFDLLLVYDSKVLIVDWKTTSKKYSSLDVSKDVQALIYCYIAKRLFPDLPVFFEWVTVQKNKRVKSPRVERIPYSYGEKDEEFLINEVLRKFFAFREKAFFRNKGDHCYKCPFLKPCIFGKSNTVKEEIF